MLPDAYPHVPTPNVDSTTGLIGYSEAPASASGDPFTSTRGSSATRAAGRRTQIALRQRALWYPLFMVTKPATIDGYLATVSADRRAALEKLRKTIRSIVPDAEECISYSMPAFRYGRHVVAGFLATSKGCSYFPFSGSTLATLAANVKTYSQTKSALHFDPKHPLPVALVRKLLKARIAETDDAGPAKRPRRAPAKRVRAPRTTTPTLYPRVQRLVAK